MATDGKVAWRNMRSLLFVPATNERFVQGASRRGADAIILDLEDSVPMSAKEDARRAVGPAIAALAKDGVRVLVRINAGAADMVRLDLASAVRPGLSGLIVPKVEDSEDVERIAAELTRAERQNAMAEGAVALLPTIETPKGLTACERIAGCHGRIAGLMFGPEDFSAGMGIAPSPTALAYPAQRLAVAAHANGLAAFGLAGTVADIDRLVRFRRIAEVSRAIGMTGAGCVHPAQVAIVNAVFGPGAREVEQARRICSAYEEAKQNGLGAINLDGMMIDEPVYRRAADLLKRAGPVA